MATVFNMAKSSLAAAVSILATTFTITDIGGFLSVGGSGDFFYAQLVDSHGNYEVVKVDVGASSVTGLSVTRGQGGSAQAWPAGTQIWNCIDAVTLGLLRQKSVARQVAFNPNSALTSSYKGEKVYQTDTENWWKAVAAGTQEWRLIAGSVFVADVGFSPAAGSHPPATTLTMTCVTAGSSIYYTTDGSAPDETDNLYSSPVTIPDPGPTTFKARGFGANRWESPSVNVTSGAYTIVDGFSGDTLRASNATNTPRSPVNFDDGGGDEMWFNNSVAAGGNDTLYSWDYSAGTVTIEDNSWPTNSDWVPANPFVHSGSLYVMGSYKILLEWSGGNLVALTSVVGSTTMHAGFSYGGSIYLAYTGGGTDPIDRYDNAGGWINVVADMGTTVQKPVELSGNMYFVNTTNGRLYEFNGTTYVEVAPHNSASHMHVSVKVFGGVLYAVGKLGDGSGHYGIEYWNGVDDWVQLFSTGSINPVNDFEYSSTYSTWYFYGGASSNHLYKWTAAGGVESVGASGSGSAIVKMFQHNNQIFGLNADSDIYELTV